MGLAIPRPAISGAEPCTGSNSEGHCRVGFRLADGAMPIVRGEAVNTATTYGYDIVTMMQETKTTICNVEKA